MSYFLDSPTAQLALYCLLVAAASLAGGWILLVVRLTHLRLQIASSFVAGLMLAMPTTASSFRSPCWLASPSP